MSNKNAPERPVLRVHSDDLLGPGGINIVADPNVRRRIGDPGVKMLSISESNTPDVVERWRRHEKRPRPGVYERSLRRRVLGNALAEELERMQHDYDLLRGDNEQQFAEIRRLNIELDALKLNTGCPDGTCGECFACGVFADWRRDRDAEVVKLREAVGLASTLAGDIEVDISDPVGMVKKVEAEITKLRERGRRLKSERDEARTRFAEIAGAMSDVGVICKRIADLEAEHE